MIYKFVSNDGTSENLTLYDENNNPVTGKHNMSMRATAEGPWELTATYQVYSNLEVVTLPSRIKSYQINGNELIIETEDNQ